MFNTVLTSLPQLKSGKVKALAVTSRQRSPLAPELPTMIESGLPGFEVTPWYAVVAPVRTPKEVIQILNRVFVKVAHAPDVRERFSSQGVEMVGSTPEELDTHIRTELARWEKVIHAAGIRPE